MTSRVCAVGATLKGIDVWEGNDVDWTRIHEDDVAFAFARVSDGVQHPDAVFSARWPLMKGAGVVRGAYQFYRPKQDAAAQAKLFVSALRAVGGLTDGDLPPVIDVEVDDGVASSAVVQGVRTWVQIVAAETGRTPIVYTSPSFGDGLGNAFSSHELWIANYGARCPSLPDGWTGWKFWQYSERGALVSVKGEVDLNLFNGTLADLRALAGATKAPQDAGAPPPVAVDASAQVPTPEPETGTPGGHMGTGGGGAPTPTPGRGACF